MSNNLVDVQGDLLVVFKSGVILVIPKRETLRVTYLCTSNLHKRKLGNYKSNADNIRLIQYWQHQYLSQDVFQLLDLQFTRLLGVPVDQSELYLLALLPQIGRKLQ